MTTAGAKKIALNSARLGFSRFALSVNPHTKFEIADFSSDGKVITLNVRVTVPAAVENIVVTVK